MDKKELIESYRNRLRIAESIADFEDNDDRKYLRLRTKAACYREFIAELTRIHDEA